MFGDAQLAPQIGAHGDDFGVDVGTFKAQRFDADLVKLAVAPFLRALAAEHRPHVPQLLRGVIQQVVFDYSAQAGSGAFGAQTQAETVVGIGEGVHFFADYVGFFADGAHEKIGRLDDGGTDLCVAEAARPAQHGFFKGLPQGGVEFEVCLFNRQ